MRTLSGSVPIGARVTSSAFVATPRTPSDRNGSGTRWNWPPRRTSAPGSNRLQVERVEVELALRLGVGGEEHLEATVELKAFDQSVRTRPPMPSDASRTTTSRPASVSTQAHARPARPAPTMATSTRSGTSVRSLTVSVT